MIKQYLEKIQAIQYKSDLEFFLSQEMKKTNLEQMQILYNKYQDDYLKFALNLREKIIGLVLKKGDVGDSFYLSVYLIFAPIRQIPYQAELDPFIQTSKNYFLQEGLGDLENLMLLELETLCLILNGETKQAIRGYIQGVSHLEMHLREMGKVSEFIREFFPKMNITMEFFLESIQEILEFSYYTQLPIMRARSILNWQLHCFWNVQNFFNHRSWLELYPLWKEAFYFYLQSNENLDHAMYMQFFIYHMCGNSYSSQEQWREFCIQIDQVASKRYREFAKEHSLEMKDFKKEKDSKTVIGILRDRIVENSPYKVEYSFLKQILASTDFKERYIVKIYLMSLLEKSENSQMAIQSYQKLGVEVVDIGEEFNAKGFYNSHLQKALRLNELIKEDKVEILISPNNGYGISDFVLSARSAKKQIFWSHGNFVYDIPNVDLKMTHICGNSVEVIHEGYSFIGVPVVMDQDFYNPFVSEEIIAHYRSQYPKDTRILGTIGRLTKIDSFPYLQMLVKIMKKFPDTIYLACGSGNIEEIKAKLREILQEDYENFIPRFYFCGYVNSAIYGHLIDFWPDSFPMEQGESRIEYVAKGNLSLVLAKNKEAIKQEWITMAGDEEDYESKATYILSLSDEQRREKIEEIMAGLSRYNQKREELGIKSFMDCIDEKDSNSHCI